MTHGVEIDPGRAVQATGPQRQQLQTLVGITDLGTFIKAADHQQYYSVASHSCRCTTTSPTSLAVTPTPPKKKKRKKKEKTGEKGKIKRKRQRKKNQ